MSTATLLRHRTTALCAVLVALTLLSTWLGHGDATAGAAAGVLAIAFVKARWIGLDFMELRGAPRGLRLAFEAWAAVVAATLVVLALV